MNLYCLLCDNDGVLFVLPEWTAKVYNKNGAAIIKYYGSAEEAHRSLL